MISYTRRPSLQSDRKALLVSATAVPSLKRRTIQDRYIYIVHHFHDQLIVMILINFVSRIIVDPLRSLMQIPDHPSQDHMHLQHALLNYLVDRTTQKYKSELYPQEHIMVV